jgi:hypothetical protein
MGEVRLGTHARCMVSEVAQNDVAAKSTVLLQKPLLA